MTRGGVCVALLFGMTVSWQLGLAATSSDPFAIERAGMEARSAATSLPVAFRIESDLETNDSDRPDDTDDGVSCTRWTVMLLVRASRDRTWQLVDSSETDGDREVVLFGIPGRTTLVVVECAGRPGYSLHGPRVWGQRDTAETLFFRPRRTVRVGLGVTSARPVTMVLSQQYEGDSWPECSPHDGGNVECIGVPYEATGIAISEGTAGLSWASAAPVPATVQLVRAMAARWGRLVYLIAPAGGTGDDLVVTAWRQTPRPPGVARPRVRVVSDSRTDILQLGPGSFWVVGQAGTNDRFVEVKGARTTTVRISGENLTGVAADRPHRVFLRPPIPVDGLTVDTGGAPVGGALVSLFELIRSKSSTGEQPGGEIVTKRWIAETTSDRSGRFRLNGPSPGTYEFLAAHPRAGRMVEERRVNGTPITLRLRSTPRVRGRVIRDHAPVSGVGVRAVPDQLAFARAVDPVAVLAPGTVTGRHGKFELSLPGQGSGDVVIGGGGLATTRRRYADAGSLPDVTDLGDIVLPASTQLTVRLPRGGCELVAAGPIGALGMGRVRSSTDLRERLHRFELPETGFWWLEARCDGESRTLVPPAVRVDRTSSDETIEVAFASPGNSSR